MSSNSNPLKLESLPEEILVNIFEVLPRSAQACMALVNHFAYRLVTPVMYSSILLTDYTNTSTGDEHDDTPMIRMLILFVQNPILASYVRIITHQCHLLFPEWRDIPNLSFSNDNMSRDPRILCLLHRAILNLVSVQTLTIVMGHGKIVSALLRGFFDHYRVQRTPVRRLWIESSNMNKITWPSDPLNAPQGLQSIRLRRLGIVDPEAQVQEEQEPLPRFINGNPVIADVEGIMFSKLEDLAPSHLLQLCASSSCLHCSQPPDSKRELRIPFHIGALKCEQATLTSITFDYILNGEAVYAALISTRPFFPKLKALQVRNCVEVETAVIDPRNPDRRSYLLHSVWLKFLQRHPDIVCLAWPMPYFVYIEPGSDTALDLDASEALNRLGQQLKELRVDAQIIHLGENTASALEEWRPILLRKQRLFVELVAPRMKSLEVFKLEGTVPAEVRQDLLNALHSCPLKKVVIIGLHWTVGDTWKMPMQMVRHADINMPVPWETGNVVSEDELPTSALEALSRMHASTITELKFCGFVGAPVLHDPSPAASKKLAHLRYFHNLRLLTTAVWLSTHVKGIQCSQEIYNLWNQSSLDNTDDPTMAQRIEQLQIHEELSSYYEPAQLAERVAKLFGPHLSDQALRQKNGVGVKALFLLYDLNLGEENKIFELLMYIGKDGKLLWFGELMGETHPVKLEEKMQNRGWF